MIRSQRRPQELADQGDREARHKPILSFKVEGWSYRVEDGGEEIISWGRTLYFDCCFQDHPICPTSVRQLIFDGSPFSGKVFVTVRPRRELSGRADRPTYIRSLGGTVVCVNINVPEQVFSELLDARSEVKEIYVSVAEGLSDDDNARGSYIWGTTAPPRSLELAGFGFVAYTGEGAALANNNIPQSARTT